jgi:BlaI family transcriptional regulator, penicillinase repressor
MSRPASDQPTPAELEVLKVLWERGPATVRQVMETLNPQRERAYTSVMSLLNVMTDKGLLTRVPQGRAFVYEAAVEREQTLGQAVEDLLGRVFEGSASSLVAHLFDQTKVSDEELAAIRRTIREYARRQQSEEAS